MTLPFPLDPPPTLITCETAGHAIDTVALAREYCLKASYLPTGGDGCKATTPITHRVYVMGDAGEIERLLHEIKVNHEERRDLLKT